MTHSAPLPRSTPEAEGIASQAILDFVNAVEQHDRPLEALHGFMLLRHGKVVAEGWWSPYAPDLPHSLYSLSKSFTSTAIGIAVSEGLLTVDAPVISFFPDETPANPSDNLKAMTVKHLLSMNTGHHEDTTQAVFDRSFQLNQTIPPESGGERESWAEIFLSIPVEHQPGSWFVYNTGATYMLSAIITNLTGQTLVDYLKPRLFGPLGIENPYWETDPDGISQGGTGLHLRLDAVARLGQLYLQDGLWEGRQIVPAAWVAEASNATSDNSNTQTNPDWTAGYGYQFWRCRPDCYRGDGAFGQYMVILPEQDAVLAINSGLLDMQAILDKVWQHLLPAMQDAPLPEDASSNAALATTLASLSLPVVAGSDSSPQAASRSGVTYQLEPNELELTSIAFNFDDATTISVTGAAGTETLEVGIGKWRPGTTSLRGNANEPIGACGGWISDDSFEARICFTASEFALTIATTWTESGIDLLVEPNVSWDEIIPTRITGRVA